MKYNHVVCYEDRKLKERENNYATHDLEFATIVQALKMRTHYLMSIKFEPRTNQRGLKYCFSNKH